MGSTLEYRDGRFWRDGEPFFLVAAEYQYYRDHRTNWLNRLSQLKAAAVNTITFYVPWRHHLRHEGGRRVYDFAGRSADRRDLVGFLERIASLQLHAIAKPGPFVHSELNVGGLPDLVCPTFNPAIPPACGHTGQSVVWDYDGTTLPAPFDERFDALAQEWLHAVREALLPFVGPEQPLIALQLNDETLYCTSNAPPWTLGYEPSGMRFYHDLLARKYGSLEAYNRCHGTRYDTFDAVPGPRPRWPGPHAPAAPSELRGPHDLLGLVDWAEYQWRLRRDLHLRYQQYLALDLPQLTNFAGITPPIEENIPGGPVAQKVLLPAAVATLYPEWWFATNRIDQDAEVYQYGFISWLGVAAYDEEVFDRYVNTARRGRGINMEENWGFATLYDERSKHPLVPFYQTLVSVAAGATGYVIFCGVSHDAWDDDLDRVTKRGCPTFPSDAPISSTGELRPMYFSAAMLNRWFADHGAVLLRCRIDADAAYLIYPPYAAVSSWVPGGQAWGLTDHSIPRCGREGFEEFSRSLQRAGYSFAAFELEPATRDQMTSCRSLALHSAFFMDPPAQHKLAEHIQQGGRLFISGELPVVDLRSGPCTVLRDAVRAAVAEGLSSVTYREESLFSDGRFAQRLAAAGVQPTVTCAQNMRAFVHRGDGDLFVFFFSFSGEHAHDQWIEFDGNRVELRLGPKTCGVLRVAGRRITAYLVKGVNEVEGVASHIRIQIGDQVVEGIGDLSSSEGSGPPHGGEPT